LRLYLKQLNNGLWLSKKPLIERTLSLMRPSLPKESPNTGDKEALLSTPYSNNWICLRLRRSSTWWNLMPTRLMDIASRTITTNIICSRKIMPKLRTSLSSLTL
jgi:hypothetical protein